MTVVNEYRKAVRQSMTHYIDMIVQMSRGKVNLRGQSLWPTVSGGGRREWGTAGSEMSIQNNKKHTF